MDKFIDELISHYPQVKEYQNKIVDVIVKSGCQSIEFANFKHRALGCAVHNGVLINRDLLDGSLHMVLFVIFHELGHQYQFKKYGVDQMYECYLGNMTIEESINFVRNIEITADEFAIRKIREFVNYGYLIPSFNPPRIYKDISDEKIKSVIEEFKTEFVKNNVTTPEGISSLMYELIKDNEKFD